MALESKAQLAVTATQSGGWFRRMLTPGGAAIAGMAGPLMWALIFALLDVIQYDFLVSMGSNPFTMAPASENGVGPYGWLYLASDFIFGWLIIAFALGLYRSVKTSVWLKLGIGALVIYGFAFVFGSARCDCLLAEPVTLAGTIHNLASYVILLGMLPICLLICPAFRKDVHWRGYDWYSLATGLLAAPLFVVATVLPPVFSWFYLWLLLIPLGWIEVIAIRCWVLSCQANGAEVTS